jgi:hypothetical protein
LIAYPPDRQLLPVFGSGGKLAIFLLWREIFITTGKKKKSSRLSGGYAINYDWKKRRVVSFWFWQLRPEKKKVPVVCLAGCAVASVFGSGDYDRKKKVPVVCLSGLCYDRKKKIPVIARAITTGKKKIQVVIKFVLVQLEL